MDAITTDYAALGVAILLIAFMAGGVVAWLISLAGTSWWR